MLTAWSTASRSGISGVRPCTASLRRFSKLAQQLELAFGERRAVASHRFAELGHQRGVVDLRQEIERSRAQLRVDILRDRLLKLLDLARVEADCWPGAGDVELDRPPDRLAPVERIGCVAGTGAGEQRLAVRQPVVARRRLSARVGEVKGELVDVIVAFDRAEPAPAAGHSAHDHEVPPPGGRARATARRYSCGFPSGSSARP